MKIFQKLLQNSSKFHIANHAGKINFGTTLKWETSLERGLVKIKATRRPGMMIVHKTWCGACRTLKPKFDAHREIEALSTGFILISLSDDNQPKEKKYMPDGEYVPRILFINPHGIVMTEVINENGSADFKYFYSDADSIAKSMKRVLDVFPKM